VAPQQTPGGFNHTLSSWRTISSLIDPRQILTKNGDTPKVRAAQRSGSDCSCPACGSPDTRVLYPGLSHVRRLEGGERRWDYEVRICESCGLGFMRPLPDIKTVQDFYPADYGCYCWREWNVAREVRSLKYRLARWRYEWRYSKSPASLARGIAASIAEWLAGRAFSYPMAVPLNMPKSARVLDVGYGTGLWLLVMAELGFRDLHGFDIDANPENRERLERAGVNLRSGDFTKSDFPDGSFDCVRMEHVFEHLANPVEVLARCRRLLKDDGVLLMCHPTIESLAFAAAGTDYEQLDLPRHIMHHTVRSTRFMLRRAGFQVERITRVPLARSFENSVNQKYAGRKLRIPHLLFLLLAPAYVTISRIARRGENIMVIARKTQG